MTVGLANKMPQIGNVTAVLIFPLNDASTLNFLLAANTLTPIIANSLAKIRNTGKGLITPIDNNGNKINNKILSASGSSNFPSSDTILNRLATHPSNASVLATKVNKIIQNNWVFSVENGMIQNK